MNHAWRSIVLAAGVIASVSGCGRCSDAAWQRVNAAAFGRYAQTLQTTAGTRLDVETCAMFGPTRAGYCVLRGSAADVARFVAPFSSGPGPKGARYKASCAELPPFGAREDGGVAANFAAGAGVHAPAAKLPPNQENVRLRALVIDPSGEAVCLELEFPYG